MFAYLFAELQTDKHTGEMQIDMIILVRAGERAAETARQLLDQSDRLRQLVLHPPQSLHVHPVAVLPVAGGDSRPHVRNAHRHVEPG